MMKELSKEQIQMTKGIAIISMVVLHLFCRKGIEVYGTPLIWINSETPFVYYFGFLGEVCVSLYCLCSGYAHYRLGENAGLNIKKLCKRLMKFLLNFWILCILFSIIGLIFDSSHTIPANISTFFGNFFLLRITYNGAWWFAATYVYLVILSPIIFRFVKKSNSLLIGVMLFMQYIIIELAKHFGIIFSGDGLITIYISTQLNNFLGSVLFAYGIGMILAKKNLISHCGMWLEEKLSKSKNILMVITVIGSCVIVCILEKGILMPLFAILVFIVFNLWNKCDYMQKIFMFLGKHSTNIWLVHMFFYLYIFKNLVIIAKYPILIFGLMMIICISISYIILAIYKPIVKIIN